MPVLPASLIEPLWVEFAALIGAEDPPEFSPTHPWGCQRRRVPDRVVFEHVIAALVHGSGYERLASPGCSDRIIRRRLRQWAEAGLAQELLRLGLAAYDRMIGLNLDDLAVDGAITKSHCGGEVSGRSPVDRGKQGTKRSVAAEGIPLHLVAARANDHDSPLLEPDSGRDLRGDRTAARPSERACAWTAATTRTRPATCSRSWAMTPTSPPRASRPPSRPGTLAGQAHPLLAQRLRQTPPLPRQAEDHRRVLPLPRRRAHRDPPPHQPSPHPLPLTTRPTTQRLR